MAAAGSVPCLMQGSDHSESSVPPGPGILRGAVRRTFGSLDTHNYRLYFFGDLVSHVGGWMQTMAEAWLVLRLTGSGVAVGATFAFRFLPVLLFGLWGGVVADRFDRRRVLLVTQTLAALLAVVLWLIVLTGVVQVWMVFALAIALGFVTVVDEPARQAFVEEMVGRERVPNAIALDECRRQLGAHHRARHCGSAHLLGRRGVGVLRERGVVRGGARRAGRDAEVGVAAAALAYEPAPSP